MSSLPSAIRAFIAIRLPDDIVTRLMAFQRELKSELANVSWCRPEAMHITLQFLGAIQSADLPRLTSGLNSATERLAAFDLEVCGVGCFGNRVLWVGIGSGFRSLEQLARAVRRQTAGIGSHGEKREFNAHVTLGRFREPTRGSSALISKNEPPPFGQFRVGQVELIRSELSPKGSRYTTLHSFILGRKNG